MILHANEGINDEHVSDGDGASFGSICSPMTRLSPKSPTDVLLMSL